MEVPDWLMKPTDNNREHIKILTMIEHVRRASERIGVDAFLTTQIDRLQEAFTIHCKNTVDLDENPVMEVLEKDKKKTVLIGALVTASILIPYTLLTKTNLLHPRPRDCWELTSPREQRNTQVCLLAIDKPYNPSNGDVSVALSLDKANGQETVVNADFWIASKIGNRAVDYRGEFNISRTRIYRNHWLVDDDRTEWSSWVKPMIPEDSVIELWDNVKKRERSLNYAHPLLEDQALRLVERGGAIFAAIGSIGFTLWEFFKD